jgi:hypothetical protein
MNTERGELTSLVYVHFGVGAEKIRSPDYNNKPSKGQERRAGFSLGRKDREMFRELTSIPAKR